METKTYSSSGFSHKCSPEELYVLTRHWLSDIVFFELEINYFIYLVKFFLNPENRRNKPASADQLLNRLQELLRRKEFLKENIISHQNELSTILDKNSTEKQLYFNVVQSKLEGEIFDFIKSYRHVKKEFFSLTPILMEKAGGRDVFV